MPSERNSQESGEPEVIQAWTHSRHIHDHWLPFFENLRRAIKTYAMAQGISADAAAKMVITPTPQNAGGPASITFAMNTDTLVDRKFFDMFCCKLLDRTSSLTSEVSPSGRRGRVILTGSGERSTSLGDLLNVLYDAGVVFERVPYQPPLATLERWGLDPTACGMPRGR